MSKTVTYMPLPDDPDETVFAGVAFKAYEPVEMDEANPKHTGVLAGTARNGWFTDGEVDTARHDKWKRVRDAQAAMKAHQAEVEQAIEDARKS